MDLPFIWRHRPGGYGDEWVEEANPSHAAADVQMFSGCRDEQCSADASFGGSRGGAMTKSFLAALEESPGVAPTYPELMGRIYAKLRERGFEQVPQLSSSQRFDQQGRRFSVVDGIVPNANPELGRIVNKRYQPPADYGDDGGDDS